MKNSILFPNTEKVLFPILSNTRPEDRPTLLSILDFSSKILTITSQHDAPSVLPFKIAVSLHELVGYLREVSQIPFYDPETKIEGISPVERASSIGQHLIETVGMYPFKKLRKC